MKNFEKAVEELVYLGVWFEVLEYRIYVYADTSGFEEAVCLEISDNAVDYLAKSYDRREEYVE